jgi:hypothetical protein
MLPVTYCYDLGMFGVDANCCSGWINPAASDERILGSGKELRVSSLFRLTSRCRAHTLGEKIGTKIVDEKNDELFFITCRR